MTTFWPKRDEDGRHVNTGAEHGGPIANFKPSCEPDHVETLKPLSELLAKLDPDVVEQARADGADELKEGSYTFNKVTKEWMHEDDFTPCRRCGGDGYHRNFRVQEMVSMMVCTLCDGACCE